MEKDKIFLKYRKSIFALLLVENTSCVVDCVPGTRVPQTLFYTGAMVWLLLPDIVEDEVFYHL